MQEILEQIRTLFQVLWRYRWTALLAAWLVALTGWCAIFFVPNVYEASAKVYADTDSLLGPLLKGIAVESNINNRLSVVTRTLLSWPNLEKVIRKTDMDLDVRTDKDRELLLNSLANKISVKSARGTDLYTITFEHKDPEHAKKVVQALLDIFLETTLGEKREDSSVAQQFLQKEVEEYEKKLLSAESRLVDFKKANPGALPGQERDYFGRLSTLRSQLDDARFSLTQAEQRVAALTRELNSFKKIASENQPSTLISTSVDERLNTLRNTLDELLLRYTDEHPTVIETRESIAELELKREEELKNISPDNGNSAVLSNNPLYQELRLAISEAQAKAAEARVSVAVYSRRIADMQNAIETLPQIEAQLVALNRDYNTYKEQYNALIERRESAKISDRAEASGDRVKLQIVEPPRVPLTPSGPNRFLLTTIVLIISLMCAVGLVFLLGEIKPVIYDVKALRQATGLPVLGSITVLESLKRHYHGDILRATSFAGVASTLFVAYAVVLTAQILYFEQIQIVLENLRSHL